MEHPGGEGNLCRRSVVARELAQDVVDSLRLVVGGLVVCAKPSPKLLHGMPRKPVGSLRRIERLLEPDIIGELTQPRCERARDEMVPRTGVGRRHGREGTGRGRKLFIRLVGCSARIDATSQPAAWAGDRLPPRRCRCRPRLTARVRSYLTLPLGGGVFEARRGEGVVVRSFPVVSRTRFGAACQRTH